MKPLRHRLRLRIAIFAMLALLWSQTALAWHAAQWSCRWRSRR
ncbi:hypothetical protein [Thermomonas fusca]|nr:hypothetical protein [Thermomonas fusca]